MKQGRPKDIYKASNRKHSVVLSSKAEIILREAIKLRNGDMKWFNRYISERLCMDFVDLKESVLVQELNELQNLSCKAYLDLENKAKELKEYRLLKEDFLVKNA